MSGAAAAEQPTPPRWQRPGRSREPLSDSSSAFQPCLRGCLCIQPAAAASVPVASLDIASLCLLGYYCSLFLFLKAFGANGSSKACLARNVFVAIKGCFM